jgi:hypothetical protein
MCVTIIIKAQTSDTATHKKKRNMLQRDISFYFNNGYPTIKEENRSRIWM